MGLYAQTVDIAHRLFRRLKIDSKILEQAIFQRLSTKRGTYWHDREYGLDLTEYVNAGLDAATLGRIPFEVAQQLELDDRIERAVVTASAISTTANGAKLAISIAVKPFQGDEFTTKLTADGETVSLG